MAQARHGSEVLNPAPLFQPLKYVFSGREAKNRFLKAAMSEKLATWDPKDDAVRGIPTKELVTLYKNWGAGGWGTILTGNIMIDGLNLEAAGNLIIPRAEPFEGRRFEGFRDIAAEAKKNGSIVIGQVSHSGRQVEEWIQANPIGASDVQLRNSSTGKSYGVPRAATKEDISELIDGFAHAAQFLEKAGFDGIELHGGHGYLLAQFLSPRTNKRTDEYGGSRENRFRFVMEVIEEIQRRVRPDFIIGIKYNAVEYTPEGVGVEDAKALVVALEKARVDFVETSGGNYEKFAFAHVKESNRERENFFLSQAEEIAKALKRDTKVFSTGGFKTVKAMVAALDAIDGVGIGHASTQEPRLPIRLMKDPITGVIRQLLGEDDMMGAAAAGGVQITQIAHNHEPVDLSVQEGMDAFRSTLQQYFEKVGADTEHNLVQWPLVSGEVVPYQAI